MLDVQSQMALADWDWNDDQNPGGAPNWLFEASELTRRAARPAEGYQQ